MCEYRWEAKFSALFQTSPGYRVSLKGVKRPRIGVDQLTHLMPRLEKVYSYVLLSFWPFMPSSRVTFSLTFVYYFVPHHAVLFTLLLLQPPHFRFLICSKTLWSSSLELRDYDFNTCIHTTLRRYIHILDKCISRLNFKYVKCKFVNISDARFLEKTHWSFRA